MSNKNMFGFTIPMNKEAVIWDYERNLFSEIKSFIYHYGVRDPSNKTSWIKGSVSPEFCIDYFKSEIDTTLSKKDVLNDFYWDKCHSGNCDCGDSMDVSDNHTEQELSKYIERNLGNKYFALEENSDLYDIEEVKELICHFEHHNRPLDDEGF